MRNLIVVGCIVLAVYAFGLADSTLQAQPYPNRPIQVVIPMGPGSAADTHGRILMEELKEILKTEIIVVNKPGASMTIGTDFVVNSKKDGYTLLYTPTTGITAKAVEPETVPYDPMRDLEPLGLHAFFPVVIAVLENAPWETLKEFVDYAKKNPGKIRISTPGLQTHSSINVVIIETLTGAQYTLVPFKEGAQPITALLGGHVEATSFSFTPLIPHVHSKKVRVLLTSSKIPDFPNIPTLNELGFKQGLLTPWFAMFAPAGVPEGVKKILVPAIKEAIHNPEVIAKIKKIGGSVIDYKSPEELEKIEINDLSTFSKIAVKLGLRK
jgi:tripartite-type tricarboxylate transporter receptor subunit TctC